jgi:branched-chain amino acid transport system substrate-binding protein
MASDGCFLYEFIDGSGPAAEGAYVSGITPDPKLVTDQQWWLEYQELETRNPGTYSIAGYSAMAVIAEGVKKAKSLETARVTDAIRSLDFDTLVGHISYDSVGDLREQHIYIFQVQDGSARWRLCAGVRPVEAKALPIVGASAPCGERYRVDAVTLRHQEGGGS